MRGVSEELGTSASAVDIEASSLKTWSESFESPSYPSLRSEYTIHQLTAEVDGLPTTEFSTEEAVTDWGHATPGAPQMVHVWHWRRDADALVAQIRQAIITHEGRDRRSGPRQLRDAPPSGAQQQQRARNALPSHHWQNAARVNTWPIAGKATRKGGSLGRRWNRS